MADVTGKLREPDQMDWDNHNPQSRYSPPPPALDAAGEPIIYEAKLPTDMRSETRKGVTDEGLRSYEFGPLQVKNGSGKSHEIRFFTQSVKKFTNRKTGEQMNVSGVSKVLRGAGSTARPQTTAEYDAAVAQIGGRNIRVTLDWVARNRDTGEEVVGYLNFPEDPERPGQRKAILRKGETLPDGREVKSEILFANARVRYVVDGGRK